LKASVVIPAKNGGDLLVKVVEQVLAQRTPWPFEVWVIDSGSSDNSIDALRTLPVNVHTIPSQEFGHGKTRNLGASLSKGEFIAYLTHDALPANGDWLNALVDAASINPETAGAFGAHLPYPDASPMLKKELSLHFMGFGSSANIVRMDDAIRYKNDVGYRQFLHYFSNNNSCLRRSVWEKIPFKDVDFAEDQLWARDVIEAGYAKAYAPSAQVYHSHNFGIIETYSRAFDESRALNRIFGYRLAPSLAHALWQTVRLSRRDWKWISEDDEAAPEKLAWLLKIPFLNLARMGGFYLGGHHNKLSERVTNSISRDKKLFKS
jgi:rhamnosyltransferase